MSQAKAPVKTGRLQTHEKMAAALNRHDAEEFLSYYTDDVEYSDYGAEQIIKGKRAFALYADAWFANVPDIRFELHRGHAAGSYSTAEWTMSGTVHGELPGLPSAGITGKHFSVKGGTVLEFAENGLIRREWDYWNAVTMLRQLGLTGDGPAPE